MTRTDPTRTDPMTTTEQAPDTRTTLTLLFPPTRRRTSHDSLRRRLRDSVHVSELHTGIPPLARDLVWAELATLVGRAMATDLVTIVSRGWQTSAKLVTAAQRTADDPDSSEVVNLAEHTIEFSDVAALELVIDERARVTLRVRVAVDLHVMALAACIEHGHIVSLRSGRSDVTVRLFVESDEIAHRRVDLDLAAEIRLGSGINLMPTPDRPPVVELPTQPTAATARSSVPPDDI
jgi:hypothetical protein